MKLRLFREYSCVYDTLIFLINFFILVLSLHLASFQHPCYPFRQYCPQFRLIFLWSQSVRQLDQLCPNLANLSTSASHFHRLAIPRPILELGEFLLSFSGRKGRHLWAHSHQFDSELEWRWSTWCDNHHACSSGCQQSRSTSILVCSNRPDFLRYRQNDSNLPKRCQNWANGPNSPTLSICWQLCPTW